ncbi:hypothetical protein SAMD00019534_122240 [Acytostelium subglobosum LB1]|uniref:hypothetical protein n=1 Tax=Acytostelium subglobosum LB1 TaxID=1410327 RepID=UPI000644D95B|nr:hypothetical protein SAMD00019534_122240 [Acytostelium subglobosum LB1]GAM29048.1 hypothetical protein SAMD00019534_122240 [Acytostelium subglobosum LB1]|eukprot:XP_012748054.1 hypothetical protein SAMD00019534_122240 [Acytostelium subglobosum LB1]
MISTAGIRIAGPFDKENAPVALKNKLSSTSKVSTLTPSHNSLPKQKSMLSMPKTPRMALGDVTNSNVTPNQSLGGSKSKLGQSNTMSNLLFVPSSSSQPTSIKKKPLITSTGGGLVSVGKPRSLVKTITADKKDKESERSVPMIDPMYPPPPVPLSLGVKLSNNMIERLVMTPSMIDLVSEGGETLLSLDDTIDFGNDSYMDIAMVPEINEAPPSPLRDSDYADDYHYGMTSSTASSTNTFSFTDYFNQIAL